MLELIKKSISEEGLTALLSLAVKFKSSDIKKTHHFNRKTLQDLIPYLDGENIELIFKELSQNNSEIDYSVLVYDLKGQLEE